MAKHHYEMSKIEVLIEKLEKQLLLIQLKQSPLNNYDNGQIKVLVDVIKELKLIRE